MTLMSDTSTPVEIPHRALFKAAEVCELLKVQPYVLRSWEAGIPQSWRRRSAGGPARLPSRGRRAGRPQIKHLLLVEGLTLAGRGAKLRKMRTPVGVDRAGHRRVDRAERARAAHRGEARAAIDSRSAGAAESRPERRWLPPSPMAPTRPAPPAIASGTPRGPPAASKPAPRGRTTSASRPATSARRKRSA